MEKHNLFHYFLTIILKLIKNTIFCSLFFLIGLGGYFIFQSKMSPYNIIFGIPLMGIGFGMTANYLWGLLLSIFSPAFNKGVCFFCRKNA